MIYLYIKQHQITKLKYFGKTTRKEPEKYLGSGTYWLRHIRKHNKNLVDTLCLWEFDNQEECTEFALKFSKENNIIESKEWSNLREENGLDVLLVGCIFSEEHKRKMKENRRNQFGANNYMFGVTSHRKNKKHKPETIEKMKKPKTIEHLEKIKKTQFKNGNIPWNIGKCHSDETKEKIKIAALKRWSKKVL
jgi:hypothetical protein